MMVQDTTGMVTSMGADNAYRAIADETLWIPLHLALSEVLAAYPKRHVMILERDRS